ncbi:helix-turn-helix domain-containing protein [Lentibacillus cibarius]|uniref:helix-turn-helix domain-containing protein n=1 Tax=Lentibacillus cibarius TaxID=2583219 RepID=UPI001F3E7ED1|nr:transcriptional regulator [Lentibacillus cibarius]
MIILEPEEFGEYLRSLRKRKGLTIKQLANLSNVSNAYISQIENGKRGVPSPDVIRKFHEQLDVNQEHLMQQAGHVQDTEHHSFPDLKSMLQKQNDIYYKGIKLSSQQCELLRKILDEFIKSSPDK